MPIRDWFRADAPWWGPYLGVAALAAVAALLVVLFVIANAAEVVRTLRPAGG